MAWRGYQRRDSFSHGGWSSYEENEDYQAEYQWGYMERDSFEHQQQQTQRWSCRWCDKDYASKAGLDKHVVNVHNQSQKPKDKPLNAPNSGQVVPCMWQSHASASSGFSYAAASSSTTTVKKPAYPQHQKREQHMAKVEIWICKICNKNFDTKPGLNRHFTMVHEQPKPKAVKEAPQAVVPFRSGQLTPSIICRYCGNSFANQSNLTRHINTVHQKNPPAKPAIAGSSNVALSKSTKVVQKNKTNVTINMYNPVIYKNCNKYQAN